jgi:NADH:ubiquinone oxidoreductase subunit F (NADH-binding)
MGGGAYICGEKALIESLEGKRKSSNQIHFLLQDFGQINGCK